MLEVAATLAAEQQKKGARPRITDAIVTDALQKRVLLYDKAGEEHYNLISALHKSVRNSDPDAALYWLARMLEAGEDRLYVARRVVRMAVGGHRPRRSQRAWPSRWPRAMPSISSACRKAIWRWRRRSSICAAAPKSNAVYTAYGAVQEDVERTAQEPVPLHLRNAPTGLMKALDYGKGYQYAHDLESKVADMQCLPDNLKDRVYYHPTEEGIEKRIKARLEEIRKAKQKASSPQRHGDTEKTSQKTPEARFASVFQRKHFNVIKRQLKFLRVLRASVVKCFTAS